MDSWFFWGRRTWIAFAKSSWSTTIPRGRNRAKESIMRFSAGPRSGGGQSDLPRCFRAAERHSVLAAAGWVVEELLEESGIRRMGTHGLGYFECKCGSTSVARQWYCLSKCNPPCVKYTFVHYTHRAARRASLAQKTQDMRRTSNGHCVDLHLLGARVRMTSGSSPHSSLPIKPRSFPWGTLPYPPRWAGY